MTTAAHEHLRCALREWGAHFKMFSRNGRWGTCSGCPRTIAGGIFPEFCADTARYDHQLTVDDLAEQWHRAMGTLPPRKPREDRLTLWAHIVAKHACIMATAATLEELIDYHDHEHQGPGTIRDHDRASRETSLHRLGAVLIEAEPEDDVVIPQSLVDALLRTDD